ncbi:hypothetical protein [Polyangium jinanense]|uniref:Uncharacterized protein n=1 Tax=Polyangium jinanense TaxID=2829994 RepID=A0A9X4ARI1_9BACT|nr:hypothetical protein [Polyangium jinanense]MDC3952554.1 hypothetical protein [Polyangium jinanense]MDC3980182.1 hypothetical protein [Polyangium jinanense]
MTRGLLDYLADPAERPLLEFAMNGTLTSRMRLAYAARLEATDPQRAEWLRLEVALHENAAEDPTTRARFTELSGLVSRDWTDLLGRNEILNCGSAKQEKQYVRFTFECPERWETLAPTEEASVRFCGRCQERVYLCSRGRDATAHAQAGHCIAVPRERSLVLGRPDPNGDLANAIFPGDD